ncbi:uncharacterized protein K452DRAFT_353118 [Neofusicoccum parvum]|uniref:Uncharacterized protein K452DRAFT_353118 n=1 Tax=Neofusicoccum parvum TaxID=310453 RepID=A0ACB5S7T3_9PEZI|nr:uncharacterized protein K452DRAFT_353118 [Neofusicoccum parvum]
MKPSTWNPNLMAANFATLGSFKNSTFEFARTDGITAEAANIYPQDIKRLVPVEQISRWATTKQRKNLTIQLQLHGRNSTISNEEPRSFYKPADDPQEMRILEIYPGHFWDDLKGNLHHCSLEFECNVDLKPKPDAPRFFPTRHALDLENLEKPIWYTALSYTWGEPDPGTDTVIECDGFKLQITRSLEMALRHFRQNDHSINMWIDQICINQSNAREKEKQISLMSKIYSHAVNTVVWLGEGTDESDEVFKLLEFISTVFQLEVESPKPEDFGRLFLPLPDDPLWKHLWELLNREWFSRLWIIQETILSNHLWVKCGKTTVYWDEFANSSSILISSGLYTWLQQKHGTGEPVEHVSGCRSVKVLSEERQHFHSFQQKLGLFSTLASTRNARSRDPRDKIYGLFGVCSPSGIKVSYDDGVPVADLYHDAALRCLSASIDNFPQMLSCVDHESELQGLPSWVPDWSLSRQTNSLGFSTSAAGIYAAAGKWKPCFSTRPGGKEVLVPGKIYDVVKDVSEVCSVPDITCEDPRRANQHLLPWIDLAKQCFPYPSGCTLFEAFWKTLVVGKDGEGRQRSPGSFSEIFSLLLDESTGQSPTFPDQTYSARQLRPKGKGRLELVNLHTRAPAKTYQEIRTALHSAMRSRRMGTTEKGYLGLLPRQTKPGDVVCILLGCNVPFIIRKADKGMYRLVGECYVHGIMEGEVVEMEDIPHTAIILT